MDKKIYQFSYMVKKWIIYSNNDIPNLCYKNNTSLDWSNYIIDNYDNLALILIKLLNLNVLLKKMIYNNIYLYFGLIM